MEENAGREGQLEEKERWGDIWRTQRKEKDLDINNVSVAGLQAARCD